MRQAKRLHRLPNGAIMNCGLQELRLYSNPSKAQSLQVAQPGTQKTTRTMLMDTITKPTVFSRLLSRLMPGRSRRPLSADPQSQSWVQLVSSYEEVPSLYRGFFDGLPVLERVV